jgi:glutamine synthetase
MTKVLFHEKPFKGVNGSGKHTLVTATGLKLLSPSKTPNLPDFFIIIQKVNDYELKEELLSANDHRCK